RPIDRTLAAIAGEHASTARLRLAHPRLDPLGMLQFDHRADVRRLIERRTDDEFVRRRDQRIAKRTGDFVSRVNALYGKTHLPRVVKRADGGALRDDF